MIIERASLRPSQKILRGPFGPILARLTTGKGFLRGFATLFSAAQRWHGAVRDWDKPLGFLWATGDPVATTNVLAGLRELRPAAEVIELHGIGHYPQLD